MISTTGAKHDFQSAITFPFCYRFVITFVTTVLPFHIIFRGGSIQRSRFLIVSFDPLLSAKMRWAFVRSVDREHTKYQFGFITSTIASANHFIVSKERFHISVQVEIGFHLVCKGQERHVWLSESLPV